MDLGVAIDTANALQDRLILDREAAEVRANWVEAVHEIVMVGIASYTVTTSI